MGSKLGDRWKHQGIAGVSSDSSMDVSIWQQRSNLISEDNLGVQGQSTRAHLALGWCSSSEPFLKCYHVVESHIESPSSAILKGTRWKEMERDGRRWKEIKDSAFQPSALRMGVLPQLIDCCDFHLCWAGSPFQSQRSIAWLRRIDF